MQPGDGAIAQREHRLPMRQIVADRLVHVDIDVDLVSCRDRSGDAVAVVVGHDRCLARCDRVDLQREIAAHASERVASKITARAVAGIERGDLQVGDRVTPARFS